MWCAAGDWKPTRKPLPEHDLYLASLPAQDDDGAADDVHRGPDDAEEEIRAMLAKAAQDAEIAKQRYATGACAGMHDCGIFGKRLPWPTRRRTQAHTSPAGAGAY